MPKKEINLLGEVCPFPLFQTKSELETMNSGDVLIIKTDFNQSVRNILKWCEDRCHNCDLDEVDNGIWEIAITKR